MEIAPGVHGLGSEYVNWYLVQEGDRLTAVDAGLPGFAKHLDDDLRALGRHRSDVAAVVLTHSDADHTGMAQPAARGRRARARALRRRRDARQAAAQDRATRTRATSCPTCAAA